MRAHSLRVNVSHFRLKLFPRAASEPIAPPGEFLEIMNATLGPSKSMFFCVSPSPHTPKQPSRHPYHRLPFPFSPLVRFLSQFDGQTDISCIKVGRPTLWAIKTCQFTLNYNWYFAIHYYNFHTTGSRNEYFLITLNYLLNS